MKPPVNVAVLEPAHSAPPVVKPGPGHGIKPPAAHHSTVAAKPPRLDPDRVARVQPDEAQPEPTGVKVPAEVRPAIKVSAPPAPVLASATAVVRPHGLALKKPGLPRLKPEMMARIKAPAFSVEVHRAPIIQPESRKPETVVATVPHETPAAVPVNVGAPIIRHDPAPTVVVASVHESHAQTADLLGPVREHLGQMRNVAYSTGRRSIKGTIFAVNAADQSKGPSVSITNGSF